MQDSSSVGTIFLRLVPLYVPSRFHFFLPFPFVTTSRRSEHFPLEEVLFLSSAYPFLLMYIVLSVGLIYLLSRFSCIGS
jgi:hypothetical protein